MKEARRPIDESPGDSGQENDGLHMRAEGMSVNPAEVEAELKILAASA